MQTIAGVNYSVTIFAGTLTYLEEKETNLDRSELRHHHQDYYPQDRDRLTALRRSVDLTATVSRKNCCLALIRLKQNM